MKLYNAMEESYLKENLIHKWVTNIVRQNDGYEFLLDDEVYLPVYKYALKITKRKTVKLNLVEEKVLQIVSIGVHQVDEIAKILGITRPLLDVTLADLHVKDLISVSSDICSLLKKGEQALSNLERVEKQQDIMKDIYMDSFKGKILENITRYQVVEKGIIDDNKLEPLVQAEDMKVIVSRFEDIQEIFQDEYSATRIADGIRTETQQRSMKTVFERIINLDKRNYDLKALKDNTNQAELSKIKGFIESYYGSEHYYTKAAELGVLPHSSNLQNGVKLVVEHALKNKYVSCVVCTSTLAQGVNIPIKYLLVTSIRNGLKLVKARDFQNLMGRTARAGIYTEGSIIITDCKIYDNRTNWKNGGRYLWNDCVKLFDTKLTEPCGSSILSLVQDFNIDYDVTVSGEKFIDIVIDHLDERDFLLDYAKKLEKAYLKVNPKRTQNLIVQEILLRQDIISNIENYLCLVRSAETLVNDSKKSAVDICTNTLAYAMATEKEKELLIKVFQKIEENIQQYSVEKLSRYSNAMSGIGLSSLIEEWIVQNELTEKIYTETELLYVITELYLQICGDFRYQEHIQSICKKWIDGQTPMEINNKETIGIAEVESLCNKRISYEMNFLIGNICDLIEVDGENEEQVDQRNILTLLQKKVKYGVPNMTAISICESVFNDRLLAIELAQILSDANIGTDKILNMLKAHSEEIFSCLDSYPEYFKDRLSVLMK